MVNVGGLSGIITTIIEKNAGFRYAFLFSLGSVSMSAVVLMMGTKLYGMLEIFRASKLLSLNRKIVYPSPSGSVVPKAFKALLYRKPIVASPEVPEPLEAQVPSSAETPMISPAELKAVFKSCWVL